MGKNNKKKSGLPNEKHLLLPLHSTTATTPVVDTHTHLLTTYSWYRSKYVTGNFSDIYEFVRGLYVGRNVKAIVDVWCEPPMPRAWKELADSAISPGDRATKWGGVDYWFVMGDHEVKHYNDEVEKTILEAMTHPRCVGWGEIGLDYHYDHSPRQLQQEILTRQLRIAVALEKPLTIHTREAEEDTERILKAEVPADHPIHIHCFTDSPEFARRLLDHFPNLHIGITGVISYSTNTNTAATVRHMVSRPEGPRFLLETDAPYMVPANLYDSLSEVKGRLPLCHTAMIPWVADFTAASGIEGWDTARIMRRANENACKVYGITIN
ncbi:hypothetical protein EDD16DRAFT_1841660 [Pisolithus croceorrhizus]|nr:hypothetical protein EDD16DRAFT_1841660 [Pisolithus croceorrhizus]KAI6139256.1 hypothetical protein EDD17DRAFT_1500380 [Pisolithus thermaeus]